jgi:hypothetical protein
VFAVGLSRLIEAIAALSNSNRILDFRHVLFAHHLWVWGVWDLVIAGLALVVGVSLLRGGRFGLVGGYVWSILVFLHAFTLLRWAPTYATVSLVISGLVIYALSREADVR